MSKWEQIDFKDIRERDKVKGVWLGGGGATKGVVSVIDKDLGAAYDAHGALIAALRDHAIYRRKPKKPAFVALDIPKKDQWIEATLRSGEVMEFRVNTVTDEGSFWSINEQSTDVTLPKEGDRSPIAGDILSWRPVDPPTPPEPEGFGYVGYVTDARVWAVNRTGSPGMAYMLVSFDNGAFRNVSCWADVLALGTFTAVKP